MNYLRDTRIQRYKYSNSPRGPIAIDPETRDIIQNEYLREVYALGCKRDNLEIETIGVMVKDARKELNRK